MVFCESASIFNCNVYFKDLEVRPQMDNGNPNAHNIDNRNGWVPKTGRKSIEMKNRKVINFYLVQCAPKIYST